MALVWEDEAGGDVRVGAQAATHGLLQGLRWDTQSTVRWRPSQGQDSARVPSKGHCGFDLTPARQVEFQASSSKVLHT